MSRLTWDETWMGVAKVVSRRSGCVARQAGAVIVGADNRIVSTGYNGPPASYRVWLAPDRMPLGGKRDGTCELDCPRAQVGASHASNDYSNCIAAHAEANALLHAHGRDTRGASIFMWPGVSCYECAKLVAAAGIVRVVALLGYERDIARGTQTLIYWSECNIDVTPWSEDA